MEKIKISDEELKKNLTEEEYYVTQKKGTERPFSGQYINLKDKGTFVCTCCGNKLFSSETKFDSGSGWPSFYEPLSKENVETNTDKTHSMIRTEVICNKCGAHLGHVFTDGPQPTGLRYCINSVSLKFQKDKK